jgi:high affinity choline transporter 7
LAVIAAAVMSSTDASMVSAASMASWNIWHRIFRPQSTAADLSVVIKRSILVVGVTATALAIQVRSVASLWILCSDLIYCVLFPVLVVALFDKKANRYGVLAGMGVAFFLRIGGGEPAFGLPHFLPYPMFEDGIVLFPFRTLAMVSGLLTILLISRLTQKQCPPIAL